MEHIPAVLLFRDDQLIETEAPNWFTKATAEDRDWSADLRKVGVVSIEEFDNGGDSLEVYRTPDATYLIVHRDGCRCIATVFINTVADYLVYRAKYITPLAMLIMETDRHDAWQKTNRRRVAS